MTILTDKQTALLAHIRERVTLTGRFPALRELGKTVGCNQSTIYSHVRALVRKGHLRQSGRYGEYVVVAELTDPIQALRQAVQRLEAENAQLRADLEKK